jgi:hypothetical protein
MARETKRLVPSAFRRGAALPGAPAGESGRSGAPNHDGEITLRKIYNRLILHIFVRFSIRTLRSADGKLVDGPRGDCGGYVAPLLDRSTLIGAGARRQVARIEGFDMGGLSLFGHSCLRGWLSGLGRFVAYPSVFGDLPSSQAGRRRQSRQGVSAEATCVWLELRSMTPPLHLTGSIGKSTQRIKSTGKTGTQGQIVETDTQRTVSSFRRYDPCSSLSS